MYICYECGHEFETAAQKIEKLMYNPDDHYTDAVVDSECCPMCGSEQYGEADTCHSCGGWMKDGILCDSCADWLNQELDKMRVVLDIGKDDFQDAIANSFGW